MSPAEKNDPEPQSAAVAVEPTVVDSFTADPPPNGGTKAWTQVFMCWIVIFISWGYVNAFGTFQAYYLTTLPQSQSTISWIGSIQVFLCFSAGAFSGRLHDAGYFPAILGVGSFLQVFGIFMNSISTQYWHLILTQGILTGLGGGVLLVPCVSVVLTYFSTRRAIAFGIVTTSNSLGGMLYPIITRELLPKIGFGWTMRLIGFIHLACFAVVATFMRPRLPPRKAGPLVDLSAFRESVFSSYVAGMFCFQWATYYTLYYVCRAPILRFLPLLTYMS
jgi:MFS family permease